MEPLTFFAATVGVVSGCHICSSIAKVFGYDIYSKGSQPHRDDWYCFFKTTDLLGPEKTQATGSTNQQRLDQRRRQQQQRPRLQA